MKTNNALLQTEWRSPMTLFESELLLVAWAIAARHHHREEWWAALDARAEIWLELDGVRATA